MEHTVKITVITEGDVREINEHAESLHKMVEDMVDLLNDAVSELPWGSPANKKIRRCLDDFPRTRAIRLVNKVDHKLTMNTMRKEIDVESDVESDVWF